MGIKKNIKKLLSEPTEMSFIKVASVLNYFGYELVNIDGSHHHFYRKGLGHIVIPIHKNKVKRFYLKKIKDIIETQLL